MTPGAVDTAVDLTVIDVHAITTPVRLGIVGPDGGARVRAATLARDWSRCTDLPAGEAPRPLLQVTPDDGVRPEVQDYLLTTQVTALAVERAAGKLLMLHACGLSDPHGRVLALVGPSGAGKSTAAATLGRALGYVTDEVVAIDDGGAVVAFPRPVALDDELGSGAKRQFGPDSLNLLPCAPELSIGRLVLLDRRPDHVGDPRLTPVPMAEALLELVPQTSALSALEGPLQRLGRLVDLCGGVFRLTFRDITDAEGVLLDLLATAGRTAGQWSVPDDVVMDDDDVTWALLDGRVRRRPAADVIETDGELVVLAGSVPVRLSGIGRTVWELAGAALSLDVLVRGVEAAHGHHPEARALVVRAVGELCDARVLGHGRPKTLRALSVERPPVRHDPARVACCEAADPRV